MKRRRLMKIYFVMVVLPAGPTRVGRPYRVKETAESWLPFVEGAYPHHHCWVQTCRIRLTSDGKVPEKTKAHIDKTFNIKLT